MRLRQMIAATALVAGCGDERSSAPPTIAATSAAVTFDGADATEPAAKAAHGERLSWVLGCRGCHGTDLRGQEWDNDPKGYGLLWASNLTRTVPGMSDAQLESLLRRGEHPSRPDLWLMPSELFQHLSPADMTALIAHLRTVKPAGEASPAPVLGPKALAEIKSGEVRPAAALVRDATHRLPPDLGPATAQGRAIVAMTCAECHGGQLKGGDDTPDLVAAAAYSRAEFERLLTQGLATGDRKLGLMATVAKSRFAKLTQGERDQIYAYLKARAERPQ